MKTIKHFLADESGQSVAEYALLTGLTGAAAITAMAVLGERLKEVFQSVADALDHVLNL